MRTKLAVSTLVISGALLGGAVFEKPRIFITESQALQLPGDAAVGDTKGGVSVAGGTSPHEEPNPTTLFVHGNKVAVFDKNDDLIYTSSTLMLSTAVNGACAAITHRSRK
jgi:hypothetical protein